MNSMDGGILRLRMDGLFNFGVLTLYKLTNTLTTLGLLIHFSIWTSFFRTITPRRHKKNAISSKHSAIYDISVRLELAHPDIDTELLAVQAIRISSDLYGSDIASAHELAKGYTRPFAGKSPIQIPADVRETYCELRVKCKLNNILRSKAIINMHVNFGDVVQIFARLQSEKRGSWYDPIPVLKFDASSETITVAGKNGRVK